MISKEIARSLLPFVNGQEYNYFKEFIDYKIERARSDLERSPDHDFTLKTQGRIEELRRLQQLREEVIADAK